MSTAASPDATTPTWVKIGDVEVRLAPPASMSVRYEIVGTAGHNWRRAVMASLGACWQEDRPLQPLPEGQKYVSPRPKTRYAAASYNPLIYGQMVADELLGRFRDGQLIKAGTKAYALLTQSLNVGEAEVLEEEGFTEEPEGSTG